MSKFLDVDGLSQVWGRIKNGFITKTSVSAKSTTLAFGEESEIASIDGKKIKVTLPDNPNINTAKLQVSDTTNRKINTKESTSDYIQFTGGTNKITVTDGTSTFDVGITPSIDTSHTITVASGLQADDTTTITATSNSSANPSVTLGDSGATAGGYGPLADVTGNDGSTIKVPYIKVNAKGIVTEISEQTYTAVNSTYTVNNGSFTVKTKVGDTTTNISSTSANASGNSDITFIQGQGVSLTPDVNGKTITIAATSATYSAGAGLSLSNSGEFSHTNVIDSGTVGTSTDSSGATLNIPYITYDGQGHITAAGTHEHTVSGFLTSHQSIKLEGGTNDGTLKLTVGGVATDNIAVTGLAGAAYKAVDSSITAGSSSVNVPTSAAVASLVSSALTSVLIYKGTIGATGTGDIQSLPGTHKVGDTYVVATAGTYAGQACEVGDYIICKTAGEIASDAHWNVINGENQVDNKSASLADAGQNVTIATVDGTNLTVTTPSDWTGIKKDGTVTSVSAGNGLEGGEITSSGTISLPTMTGLTATSYGPDDDSTSGSDGTSIKIPYITVDTYGRVTAISNRTYTSVNSTYTVNDGSFTVKTKVGSADAVSVGSTSANASGNSDVTFIQGSNVALSSDPANHTITISATDTTYESKAAENGGTALSLVTTGDKYNWNNKTSNTGTVTTVSTGIGLTTASGDSITETGTVKAKLKDETANSADSSKSTSTAGGLYSVEVDKSGYLAVRVPWTNVNSSYLTGQDHYKTSPTAGTAGTETTEASSGSSFDIPYVKVNADGHVTGYGKHTHTVTGFTNDSALSQSEIAAILV